jgi:hypothetical protein
LREKRSDATDDSDLASNGPQPFSHIHAPKINLWQLFFGILHVSHSDTYLAISLFILVHQYRGFRSWYILVLPGCMENLER